MKRTLIASCALALAAGIFGTGGAQAHETDLGCTDVQIGKVCAKGNPEAQTGEIYADGNEGNPEPIDGYAGVNSDEGVVACAEGDYDPNYGDEGHEGNSVVSPIPPDPGNPPSGESGPCTPTGP